MRASHETTALRTAVAALLIGVASAASADPAVTPETTPAPFDSAALRSGQPEGVDPAAIHAPPPAPAPAPVPPGSSPSLFGLLVDGGFPDGLGLSAVVRPWQPLRADAGVTYNVVGFGVRAGATLLPLTWAVSPLLRGEVGHMFESDASGLTESFGLRKSEATLLRAVSYDYASLQLGLQLGRGERFAFVLQGGLTWFRGPVKNFQAAFRAANPGSTLEIADPTVSGTVPSVTFGLLFFP
jgi:hypothetical protein